VLYLHGGGYAFSSTSHDTLIGLVAEASPRTFALDSRLTPEYAHPAQLQDAMSAYQWLLETGNPLQSIVIAGDSAGGHLALMSLIAMRDKGVPQPALCIAVSPWMYIGNHGLSLFRNDPYDWVQGYMAIQFGKWLRGNGEWTEEGLSPPCADLRGFSPIYLQADGREILHDMIRDFALVGQPLGANVMLDVWGDMPHDFQAFGTHTRQSAQALRRITEITNRHAPTT